MPDWLDRAIEQVGSSTTRRGEEAAATYLALRRQSDAAAASELARWSGLPLDTVARNRAEIEEARRLERDTQIIRDTPKLQRWLVANPNNAASAHGDVDNLGAISYWLGFGKSGDSLANQMFNGGRPTIRSGIDYSAFSSFTPKRKSKHELLREMRAATIAEEERKRDIERGRPQAGLRSVWSGLARDSVEGFRQTWLGTKLFMADAIGATYVADDLKQQIVRSQERALAIRPAIESPTGSAVYGGVTSLVQSLPALAAGMFTGGTAAVGLFGVQAGTTSYGKYRARGGTANEALVGGVLEGSIEAGTELLPTRFLFDRFGSEGVAGFVMGYLGREMLGEQLATFGQDAVDTAIANPSATWTDFWQERPMAAFNTAIATAVSVGAISGTGAMVSAFRRTGQEINDATDALAGAAFLDQTIGLAEESNLAAKDPVGFREFVASQTEDTPVENVYVPAEAVRSLFQSGGGDYRTDPFWSNYAVQIDEAVEIGGDVVIPFADAVAGFAGNKQWETLRDSVRLSPGGMSRAEAEAITKSYQDLMIDRGEEAGAVDRGDREAMDPVRRVYDTVLGQARRAGFNLNAARSYADLFAARYATRAEQRGVDAWTLFSESLGGIVSELPEGLRPYTAADATTRLVNVMRRDKAAASDRQRFGPSLLEFITSRGGIEDAGGDLKSMGAEHWHRQAPFRRRLIKLSADRAQGSMLGGRGSSGNSPDDIALAAWERGYFGSGRQDRPDINELYELIDQELRGSPVYSEENAAHGETETDAQLREQADELRAFLDQRGLDPDEASVEEIRQAMIEAEASFNYVLFDDRLVKLAGYEQSERGRIDFLADGRAVIRLFENRDMSTLLHESGHLWLEELRADARRPDAPAEVREAWDIVERWFHSNGVGMPRNAAEIPTEAHELFARGFERYFMEGKAPTSALSRAFSSFRSWLLRIYQLVGNLNAPITDDVRRVFDRMLATQEAIDVELDEPSGSLLFKDPETAGMTDAEFVAYRSTVIDSRSEAFDALVFKTMETVRRERTKEWRDARKNVRAEVEEQVRARPEFRALALLRGQGGERVLLNRAALVEDFGTDVVALLPRGVPPLISDKGGVHPDILAEMSGFRTGQEMIDMLIGVESRQRELRAAGDKRSVLDETIDIGTDIAMRERYGDPLADGSIEEEALAAIHNDGRADIIAAEIRALGRRANPQSSPFAAVPTPYQVAKQWAERVVREGKVSEQASAAALARHTRNEAKAARAAERALLEGNREEAFRQKQAQLYHHALWRAAKNAKDKVDGAVKRLGRYASSKGMPSLDPEYFDRIQELLEAYDFKRRSARERAERVSFMEWVAAKQEQGEEPYVPPRLANAGTVNFKDATVEDIIGLDDAVQSIAHLGRRKKKLLLAKEEAELEDTVAEAVAAAESLPARRFSADRNERAGIRKGVRSLDAILVKMEFLADYLDNGNPNGVFNRLLVQGATEAANTKERLVDSVLRPLVDLYHNLPKEQQRRMQQRVTVPELVNRNPETMEEAPTVFMRSELISIALNIGNESNLQKLLRGESRAVSEENAWTEEKVMAVLDRELNEQDWQFVRAVWAQVNKLWPDIVRTERELTGVEPEKVEPRTVRTRFGEFEGGYYPVVFDPTRSAMAEANYEDDAAKLLGQMGRSVSTPKGHTITRTEAAAPLLLSLEGVLFNHVSRVTTRIAYGRFVRDTLKFSKHPKIRDLFDRKLGREYHRLIKQWLQRQVNDAALDTQQLAALDRLLRMFRINTTMVGLGFRATTMAAQTSGLTLSAAEIGANWVAVGTAEVGRNPAEARRFVFERSPEMATRVQNFDRDVRSFFRDMHGEGKLDWIRGAGFWGIGNVQLWMVDMPTWIGGYRRALDEGMTEDQAVAFADKVVRKSQGSGRPKDLAEIQDAGEGYRVLTLFYSWFSVLYNKQRETVHAARMGDWRRASMNVAWIMMIAPVFSALLTGDWPNDEDEESWAGWAARKMFFGLWLSVPGIRDVASGVEREVAGKTSFPTTAPFFRAFDELKRPITDAIKAVKGEEVSERWLQNAITAPGYFVGLPTGQLGATAQYGLDVAEGDQNPEGVSDVIVGATKGPQEEQE